MKPSSRLALIAWVLVAAGCAPGEGGIHVVVEADQLAPADFDSLRVSVFSPEGVNPLATELLTGADLTRLPIRVNFLSGPATPVGTAVRVVALATLATSPVARTETDARIESGEGTAVVLRLARAADAGTEDAGEDAGTEDAGQDAGTFDSGSGLPTGTACSAPSACESGFCSSGVCCNTACALSCDICNLAGSEGTCALAPLGYLGAPSCSPYLCRGNAASCPTSCSATSQCATGHYCATSVCAPLKAAGAACTASSQCAQGGCVTGICNGKTFGNTAIGSSLTDATYDYKRASLFSLAEAGTLHKMSVYLDGNGVAAAGTTQSLRTMVYAAGPGALLAASSEVMVSKGKAAGWQDFTFSPPVSLPAGSYLLTFHSGVTSKVARYAYETVVDELIIDTDDLFTDGPESVFGSFVLDDLRVSIYATYTP